MREDPPNSAVNEVPGRRGGCDTQRGGPSSQMRRGGGSRGGYLEGSTRRSGGIDIEM